MARSSEHEEERGFKYQRRSREDVQARANMKGGNFDTIFKPKYKVFKVKDGKNLIRILPPTWDGAKHYGYDIWVNYGIGADNQSYLSLSKMKGEKDPIAEARREAERDGDKKLVKALNPRQRILMWVIDRNEEDEGPQLWAAPFTVDKSFAALSFDEDTKEVMYLDDPKEGCDIRFYREGTKLNTDYPAARMKIQKPSPLHEDKGLAREWLDYIQDNPLPQCLNFYDYDYIATTFDGQARVDDEDDAEDVKPRRAKTNGRDDEDEAPRRKVAADEDSDDSSTRNRRRVNNDDEDDTPRSGTRQNVRSVGDDAEQESPRRSRSRISDESDNEDDAPPPRRRRLAEADEDGGARSKADDEDDGPSRKAPKENIRDRLRRRPADDDED